MRSRRSPACSCDGHDETFQFSKCEEPFNLSASLLPGAHNADF
jgi:hypothetical protein